MTQTHTKWIKADTEIFWGEIAPTDHVVQIYENDEIFLDTLAGYVGGGIKNDDTVIIIATGEHLALLEKRLESFGIHVNHLVTEDRYIALDAEETLARFMVNGWPDQALFNKTVSAILTKAKKRDKKIRAFGEMVAVLWSQGLNGATVQLEHLWNEFCASQEFCLFCAYPKTGFTNGDLSASLDHICCAHSKMINGAVPGLREVHY
ncbi:MAG: hypothetical protein K0Q66_2419 [Chitinophagaceae bacterium]|nr:hypothetical protein [Chitinophagaceae bacterium]